MLRPRDECSATQHYPDELVGAVVSVISGSSGFSLRLNLRRRSTTLARGPCGSANLGDANVGNEFIELDVKVVGLPRQLSSRIQDLVGFEFCCR